MRQGVRSRGIGLASAVGGVVAAVMIGWAPAALADSETAEVATFTTGSPVSGSASTTIGSGYGYGYAWAAVALPVSAYDTVTWTGGDTANCATYGIRLLVNGSSVPIGTNLCAAYGDVIYEASVVLFVQSDPMSLNPGDVVTITWGSNAVSTLSTPGPNTIYVWNTTLNTPLPVTPTLAPPSTRATAGRPVWLQSVGRASAADACPAGYSPSWAQWPNAGAGGYVCDRTVYAYGDDPYPG